METFTAEKVRQHLERILRTKPFMDSVVLTRFLTFIVNETLDGRSHELKEYTIAVDALKKDSDFNPQIDSIVRIHAGRLRRALKEFYYEEGSKEEMQIVVKKGSYVPVFVKNTMLDRTEEDQAIFHVTMGNRSSEKYKGSVAVLPFEDISAGKDHTLFVKGLDYHLSTCLTNHAQLSVVSSLSTSHLPATLKDVRELGHFLNASFILTGCVQFDKHLRIHAVLNACETGEQLWGVTIDKNEGELVDLFRLQEEIVNNIGVSVNAVVGQYVEGNPPKGEVEAAKSLRLSSR